jgi:hypothetical protein
MSRLPGLLAALAVAGAAVAFGPPARANILISVDKSKQQMTVTVDGDPRYIWPVSTGRAGYDTPSGTFHPTSMERHHYSREWDNAPMPHSIFFTNEGHAIHGTYEASGLGHPVSHGCVRLSREHAATLFALVKDEGMDHTRVVLTGHIPGRNELMARREPTDTSGDIRAAQGNVAPEYGDDPYYGEPPPPPPRYYARRYYRRDDFPFPFEMLFGR